MAYENNLKILEKIYENQGFSMQKDLFEKFIALKTEEERVAVLKQVFNDDIKNFETIPLWENGAPEYNSDYELQNQPQIAFFPGKGRDCSGVVIVAPGGGYNCKVSSIEGYPIIQRLTQAGYSAALLDYRLKPYTQYVSLMDIQRAIRVLRYNAKELNIKADKIAVTGSSAGGHLSSMAAVHFDYGNSEAEDPIDRMSCRPDAAIISYGLFSQVAFPDTGLVAPYSDSDRADKVFFSPEKHVTTETPPFFMWQTCDQDDPRQLFNFAKELTDCGIRFEAHIFPYGPHGMGLADGANVTGGRDEHVMHWSELAIEWLKLNNF